MEITIADTADIDELTTVEIESKNASIPEWVEPVEVDYDIRKQRWNTYFRGESPTSSKPERIVYKAVENGKIIGFIAGHLTTRYNKDAELQSFYILKEQQRKGIGKELLLSLVVWALTNGAHNLCAGVAPGNKYKELYLKYDGHYLNPNWICWDNLGDLKQKLTFPEE